MEHNSECIAKNRDWINEDIKNGIFKSPAIGPHAALAAAARVSLSPTNSSSGDSTANTKKARTSGGSKRKVVTMASLSGSSQSIKRAVPEEQGKEEGLLP